jgi:hypothetical protein
MDDKRKVAFVLTDEALAILDKHTTPRKRGEFVSRLLVEWAAGQNEADRSGILERMERRLERMEKLMRDRQP